LRRLKEAKVSFCWLRATINQSKNASLVMPFGLGTLLGRRRRRRGRAGRKEEGIRSHSLEDVAGPPPTPPSVLLDDGPRALPSSSEECAVCLQPLEHPLVLIPCGHDGLCSHCVLQMWLHQGLPCDGVRCPLCRAKATRLRLKAPKVEDKLRARLSRVALWLYNSYTAVGWRASGVIGRLLNDKIAAGAALASVLWFLYRNMGIVRVVFVTAHRVNLVCMFLYFMYKRVTGGRAADWPPVPIVLRF